MKDETVALTKAARARFDTLAAGSIDAVFQAVVTAATQDGDMAAAKLIIDRVIPSRRGAPVSFHIRPLKTPEDCALAYADLLDDVGNGRLTPDEAQTISAIVAKRAELFASVELATEIETLKAQLAAVLGARARRRRSGARSRSPKVDPAAIGTLMRPTRIPNSQRLYGSARVDVGERRLGPEKAHARHGERQAQQGDRGRYSEHGALSAERPCPEAPPRPLA